MEDTLRVVVIRLCDVSVFFLILVLMEDTLRALTFYALQNEKEFLILVLMEDTLRVQRLVSLCLSSFDVCLPL